MVDSAFECDCERVQGRLPPRGPACPATPGRVQRSGHGVETLQRCCVVREMSPRSDRAPAPGVERHDRVGAADDPAALHVPIKERNELAPGVLPGLADRRILLTPLRIELRESLRSETVWEKVFPEVGFSSSPRPASVSAALENWSVARRNRTVFERRRQIAPLSCFVGR